MMAALPILAVWLASWGLNAWLARFDTRTTRLLVALIFGATVLILWEMIVRAYAVPMVILYEIGIIAAGWFQKNTKAAQEAEAAQEAQKDQ